MLGMQTEWNVKDLLTLVWSDPRGLLRELKLQVLLGGWHFNCGVVEQVTVRQRLLQVHSLSLPPGHFLHSYPAFSLYYTFKIKAENTKNKCYYIY